MNDSVIIAKDLSKRYKEVLALDNLDLTVKRGQLFGLVGPDGAGKTTTIQILCGILNPTSGKATVLGFDTVSEIEKIRGNIGYMSEGFSLYSTLTVDENIEFFANLYKVPDDIRKKRKEQLLHFSRLTSFIDRPAEKLSGGMKKKLALCCTLIYSPQILFLDEPTLGVDPVSRREFWKILYDFRQEGITIFVTTPYMDEAERCDRVALIHQGQIIKCDTPANLRRELKGQMMDIRAYPQKKAVYCLKNINGVLEAQIFGERIHTQVESYEDVQPIIRDTFQQNDIKLEDLRKATPSLEDIFVSAIQAKHRAIEDQRLPEDMVKPHNNENVKHSNKGELAISVTNLTKKFGDFTAVNNLNLSVKQGEIFGFLGPNGSGKSTTIKILTGLLLPSAGQAQINGVDVINNPELLKPTIGYMSQKFSLYNDLTVEENIDLYGGIYGISKHKLKQRKKWVLDMAGLVGNEKSLTRSLAGGWKQRLALGCAVLHEPTIIFLDEPTSGVDPIARRYFWDLIYELSTQGVTVFVTTHYMDEAEHCHNLGFIYKGNLIAHGSPQSLKKEKIKGEIIEIETTNSFAAIEVLKSLGYQASIYGNKIHVIVDDYLPAEKNLIQVLENNSFKIAMLEPVPVSLEDLFVILIEEDDRKNRG